MIPRLIFKNHIMKLHLSFLSLLRRDKIRQESKLPNGGFPLKSCGNDTNHIPFILENIN